MSFFSRLTNIIRSNLNFGSDIDIEKYEYIFNENAYENYDEDYNEEQPISNENDIEKEYYAILELQYGASFEQIKKAYKKLLRKYHPDLYYNNPKKLEISQKLTEKLNEAYNYFESKYKK